MGSGTQENKLTSIVQGTERRVSTACGEGSNPSGGTFEVDDRRKDMKFEPQLTYALKIVWLIVGVMIILTPIFQALQGIQVKCPRHGELVTLWKGKVYCQHCGVEIPLPKLKKKKK